MCRIILLCLMLLSACHTVPIFTDELRLSPQEITARVAPKFPMQKSLAGLLDITLSSPQVSLDSSENRLAISLDVDAKLSLSNQTQHGKLKISGRPDYIPATRSLYLRGAKVDSVQMDKLPEALSGALAKSASVIASELLDDKALHTFSSEDFTRYGMRYEPQHIFIKDNALVMVIK